MTEELEEKIEKEVKDIYLKEIMINYVNSNTPPDHCCFGLYSGNLYSVRVIELLDENIARIEKEKIQMPQICKWCDKLVKNKAFFKCSRCGFRYHISCQEKHSSNLSRCVSCKDELFTIF